MSEIFFQIKYTETLLFESFFGFNDLSFFPSKKKKKKYRNTISGYGEESDDKNYYGRPV